MSNTCTVGRIASALSTVQVMEVRLN